MNINYWFAVVGALAVALGLLSRRLRDLPVTGPLMALGIGVLVGPAVVGLLDIDEGTRLDLLHQSARISVGLAVMAVALKYTLSDLRKETRTLALLICVVLPAMTALSGGLATVTLGVPAVVALVLGATLAPTDPVLAAHIVTGHRADELVPPRVRLLASGEAAANDGLASPLVLVAAGALAGTVASSAVEAVTNVVVGVIVGLVLGLAAGRLLTISARHHDIEHASFLVITLALTITVIGVAYLVHGQAVLAVFVAGLAYDTQISDDVRREEWEVQEAVNENLVLPFFVLLGVVLPWSEWGSIGWKLAAFVPAILLFRRLPALLATTPLLRLRPAEAIFMGWFGPIGAAAVLYLTEMHELGHLDATTFAAGLAVVAASTVIHGVTGTAGSKVIAEHS